MNEQLIKFIEICLIDGIITDKEREVILRKSIELGVPVDECEIIIEGMIIKSSKGSSNSNEQPEVGLEFNEEIINIKKLENIDTSDDKLRKIFESNFKSKLDDLQQEIIGLELKVNNISNEKLKIEDEISENEIQYQVILKNRKKTDDKENSEKETILMWFTNQIETLISENKSFNLGTENFRISSNEISLKKISKNLFGKKVPGVEIKLSFEEFFKKGEFQSSYFLLENDLELLFKIEEIHNEFIKKRKDLEENFKNSILNSREILIDNDEELNKLKNKLKSLNKTHEDTICKLDEVSFSFLEVKKNISDKNFHFFKELYIKAPLLFQSNIFSKYLEIIKVKNDKEIMNLTRFVNFIIKKEKEYTRQISNSFKKLDKGNLMENELKSLLIKKQNLISFYNSFHIMYQSLNYGKMGLYMRVYLELESIGIFNTFFEETVMENLNAMNNHLQKLNNTLLEVGKGISKTNDYLSLLNNNMYELKLSVDETNYNLYDISESIQEGNGLLRTGNDLMEGLNSKVGLNNLLTGIQTYQLYKINKNTKLLRN